jgi:hypothetical protein
MAILPDNKAEENSSEQPNGPEILKKRITHEGTTLPLWGLIKPLATPVVMTNEDTKNITVSVIIMRCVKW